jgi:hypothetical protein
VKQLPAKARRSAQLRVVDSLDLAPAWTMRAGVPKTRAECRGAARPCPHVSCRHHLWLRLQQEQPGNPQQGRQGATTMRPATMETCSLDVAERGGQTFEQIGALLGVHPTRARQIYEVAMLKLYARGVDIDELERSIGEP